MSFGGQTRCPPKVSSSALSGLSLLIDRRPGAIAARLPLATFFCAFSARDLIFITAFQLMRGNLGRRLTHDASFR
jgi:hypothetical protein